MGGLSPTIKIETMNQFVILSFGVDPLNWPSFNEIREIACSTPAWCTHGLTLKTLTSRRQPVGYLQAWSRIWTRDDRERIQEVARAGLEFGTTGLRVRRADHSATLSSSFKVSFVLNPFPLVKNIHLCYVYTIPESLSCRWQVLRARVVWAYICSHCAKKWQRNLSNRWRFSF